jgi:GxxExxY protein
MLESVYERSRAHELTQAAIPFARRVELPLECDGIYHDYAYRSDIVVNNEVLVEIKAIGTVLPLHEAQALTYLRSSRRNVALLLNFDAVALKDGLCRRVR